MDFSPPRTPISANGAVSGPWRRRPPPTASPLAAAAEKGRLYREYEALKTARTLTADDVAKCWANGAALTALAILYVALKIYGILQFLNYLIAILAAIFILNLVPSFIKAEFGAVDLPDFQTWAAAKRAAPTNRAAAARASGAMPSTPAKSSSSPRTAPGTPMDLDKASPTRARADSFGSAAGSQPNASVSSEPLVSPISPLVNYVLRLGNNAEPVRDARALERVLQHASQGTPDNYARISGYFAGR